MAKETGKQRAIRIPLRYYAAGDHLQKTKNTLTLVALGVAVVWCASGFVRSESRFRYSRGEVAAVHAAWETECEVCHVPYVPIGDASWVSGVTGWEWDSDERCEKCHQGPAHSPRESKAHTPSCAGCHRDHGGRDASLVRMHDAECVDCHRDLKSHIEDNEDGSKEPAFANTVTSFVDDHPEFRTLEKGENDPGNLKFNHKLHMSPGLGKSAGIDQVEPEYRERYQVVNELLVLECSDCHRLDGGDFAVTGKSYENTSEVHATRNSGGDMIAITYENQCRACHLVAFDVTAADGSTTAYEVPHGLQPPEVVNFIRGTVVPVVPGGMADAQVKKLIRDAQDVASDIVGSIFTDRSRCFGCHQYDPEPAPNEVPEAVRATNVPDVWFPHAHFDHASHRALNCDHCHRGARPTGSDLAGDLSGQSESEELDNEVLLEGCGIDSCRACHRRGEARDDCTECHRYHNGQFPQKGRGAFEREGSHWFETSEAFIDGRLDEATRKAPPEED